MGNITINKWKCDMCGTVHDQRPKASPEVYIQAGYHWSEGPGPRIDWTEICPDCTRTAQKALDVLIEYSQKMRAAR